MDHIVPPVWLLVNNTSGRNRNRDACEQVGDFLIFNLSCYGHAPNYVTLLSKILMLHEQILDGVQSHNGIINLKWNI